MYVYTSSYFGVYFPTSAPCLRKSKSLRRFSLEVNFEFGAGFASNLKRSSSIFFSANVSLPCVKIVLLGMELNAKLLDFKPKPCSL